MNDEQFSRWEDLEAESRDAQERESDTVAAAGGRHVPGWHDTPPPGGAEGSGPTSPPATDAPDAVPGAGDAGAEGRPSVLLADSDPIGRQQLSGVMEAAGWDVRLAIDGPEALIELYRAQPDCLVLDLRLEGLSGLDLLRRLGDEGVVKDLLVIVHSTLSDSMHVHQAKALGVARFLERDLDRPEVLVDAMREQWSGHGMDVGDEPAEAPDQADSEAGDGSVSAAGFRSPFGSGGGPPGSVPDAVRLAATSRQEPDTKTGIFGS